MIGFFGFPETAAFSPVYAWIYLFQAVFGFANVVTLFFLWKQLRSSHVQIESARLQADKDFIVSVGRHSDEIYDSICDTEVIERVYTAEIEGIKARLKKVKWEAGDTNEFWYSRRLFAHVARMAAIVGEKATGCGDTPHSEVDRYFESWVEELRLRIADSDILRCIAEQAISSEGGNWNNHIRRKVFSIMNPDHKLPAHLEPHQAGRDAPKK